MISNQTSSTVEQLSGQWRNPSDVLSLLLLIGGDVVQKALAQLTGHGFRPFGRRGPYISIAPVAFSYGWVAFGFTSLMSAIGEQRLMPTVEKPALVMNCTNSFTRDNKSWILERLLRDHESRNRMANTDSAMRIDIFELGKFEENEEPNPGLDMVWWTGWLTIATQCAIAVVPWVLYGNWGVMMILMCGTLLALITGALPQWKEEKWAGPRLGSHGAHVLTRGNGHRYAMVFIRSPASYNIETLATAQSDHRPETSIVAVVLAMMWAALLICTAGLNQNAWFLVGIGGLGMLQNFYAAGSARSLEWTGLKIQPFQRKPTIIGVRVGQTDETDADVNLQDAATDVATLETWLREGKSKDEMPSWLEYMDAAHGTPAWLVPEDDKKIAKTQGALQELEKWVPTAGLALLKIFFPGSLVYEDRHVRDNISKKFWRRAWHTKQTRKNAERARREIETSDVTKSA